MNKFIKIIYCIIVLLSLASCQTLKGLRSERLAREATADNADCLAKGFTQNTDAFRLCLDNRKLERRLKKAERKAQDAINELESFEQRARKECLFNGGVLVGYRCLK